MGFIIVFSLLAVAAYYFHYNTIRKYEGTGDIIERESRFYEKIETLYTTAGYEAIREEIYKGPFVFPDRPDEDADLSAFLKWGKHNSNVNVKEDSEHQLFKFYLPAEWAAVFERVVQKEGKNAYEFQFVEWRTKNKRNYNKFQMNYTLTYIEKAILRLDPDATYELREGSYKKPLI